MANNYIKAAFTLTMRTDEAALARKAVAGAEELAGEIDGNGRAALYAELGDDFAAAFPPHEDDPFGSFLELFSDPDYPGFDCTISIDEAGEGQCEVYFGGEQIGVDAVAELLFRVAKSTLPCGFEYALDCDRLRPGEFGGGFCVITNEGVEHFGTGSLLGRALDRATGDDGAGGLVLAIRDDKHGLSFWNHEYGFGRLPRATVFREDEAARFDKPIANEEPEWLALPRPCQP